MTTPFDPTGFVQRRDGRKARIVCTDMNSEWPIIALIEDQNGIEYPRAFHEDGRIYTDDVSAHDLINVPEKHVRWVNLYSTHNSHFHKTKEKADAEARQGRIACIRIEYEEGEGL